MTIIQWVYVGVAIFIFIGTTIAGGAYANFLDVVKKRSSMQSNIGLSASEFARRVAADKRLQLRITRVPGKFTDFYSTKQQAIGISEEFYDDRSVAALAITAHELGHAICHQQGSKTFNLHRRVVGFGKALIVLFFLGLIATIVTVFMPKSLLDPVWFEVSLYSTLGILGLYVIVKMITVQNEKQASSLGINILREYGADGSEIRFAKKIYNAALITYVGAIFMPFAKIWRGFLWVIYNTIGRIAR